jgi:mannose-1-phosphate guanylyltransferase
LLRYTLALIRQAGIVEVGINTHHLPAVMRAVATAECERLDMGLTVSHEPVIQGTAGGVRGLKSFLQDEPFVLLNGDMLSGVDLGKVIAAHSSSRAAATMVLMAMPPGRRYAPVEQAPDGRIIRIAGHGQPQPGNSQWHFTGIHVIEPEFFRFISPSGEEDINRHVYPRMISNGLMVRSYLTDAYWADISNPAGYLATQRDVLHGLAPVDRLGSSSPFSRVGRLGTSWLHATARVDSAQVVGPAFFDEGCVVDSGVAIGEAVYVGQQSQLACGSSLSHAAVLEGTRVRGSEQIHRAIAWGDERLRIG